MDVCRTIVCILHLHISPIRGRSYRLHTVLYILTTAYYISYWLDLCTTEKRRFLSINLRCKPYLQICLSLWKIWKYHPTYDFIQFIFQTFWFKVMHIWVSEGTFNRENTVVTSMLYFQQLELGQLLLTAMLYLWGIASLVSGLLCVGWMMYNCIYMVLWYY